MRYKQPSVLLWAVIVGVFGTVARAEEPPRPRETVGLLLGGGGALGWAHIGILQYLEEEQIPIDSVVGTSAGGLVGGFYALGLCPAEIIDLLSHVDWESMFTGQPAYQDLSFRRKEDQLRYELGFRGGLQLPSGLDPAHPGSRLVPVCGRLAERDIPS